MPINTENAGALLGQGSGGSGQRKVRFLKSSRVNSLGRNSVVGEVASVSESDARFLCAYKYAEKYVAEEVQEVETVEEAAEEVSEETEEAERSIKRYRRRG